MRELKKRWLRIIKREATKKKRQKCEELHPLQFKQTTSRKKKYCHYNNRNCEQIFHLFLCTGIPSFNSLAAHSQLVFLQPVRFLN